jgi:predicted deacylase
MAMVDQSPAASNATVTVSGDGNTDEGIISTTAGYFCTTAEVGSYVAQGGLLGEVVDDEANTCEKIFSPSSGIVMLMRRATRVSPGDTLSIVASPL